MKYIPEEKLAVWLQLKKELALFVGVSEYFESKTFDWIKLESNADVFKCTKISTFDEGDEFQNDVQSFDTINGIEQEIDSDHQETVEGTLAECLTWINTNYKVDTSKFTIVEDLNEIYVNLVNDGTLGN